HRRRAGPARAHGRRAAAPRARAPGRAAHGGRRPHGRRSRAPRHRAAPARTAARRHPARVRPARGGPAARPRAPRPAGLTRRKDASVVERYELGPTRSQGLVDLLDRILDKGLVIAGDIRINLADVELLTIRIRLLVCSIDKADEIGLNWWRGDPFLGAPAAAPEVDATADRIRQLEARL